MDGDDNNDLLCGICLDLAVKAVETQCCHQLFCESCLVGVESCPMCRKQLRTSPSYVIRRIIGKTKKACSYCQAPFERGNLGNHEEVCPERPVTCVVESCKFAASREEILLHLTKEHAAELTNPDYKLVSSKPGDVQKSTAATKNPVDLIGAKRNESGRNARLGSTGKYYCLGPLSFDCACCNGECGPTNGCNCLPCFKLDMATRQLPPGFFLNREGYPIRKGQDTAAWDGSRFYYCGRKVMRVSTNCDGWCGPTDGLNCSDCGLMGLQLRDGGCYGEWRAEVDPGESC